MFLLRDSDLTTFPDISGGVEGGDKGAAFAAAEPPRGISLCGRDYPRRRPPGSTWQRPVRSATRGAKESQELALLDVALGNGKRPGGLSKAQCSARVHIAAAGSD
eukprot:13809061-Heterocapsa_arctica.AAC.1